MSGILLAATKDQETQRENLRDALQGIARIAAENLDILEEDLRDDGDVVTVLGNLEALQEKLSRAKAAAKKAFTIELQ